MRITLDTTEGGAGLLLNYDSLQHIPPHSIKHGETQDEMNMSFPSREQVASIRKNYPLGTRVMLNNMNDPYSPIESGTRGTVRYVDDCGQLGVAWDNGRSLSLIPGEDSFRKLTQQEIIQEQGMKMGEMEL